MEKYRIVPVKKGFNIHVKHGIWCRIGTTFARKFHAKLWLRELKRLDAHLANLV
jgi:hypothetical protein